jgi:uncharacterized protein YbjT (DUF2867 family)
MYVITGATGNTGKVVATQLLAAGEKVVAVGRNEERLQPLAKQGAEPLTADITDQAALSRAFSRARAVYLMIPPDITSPDYVAYQQRVVGALVEAVKQSGVKYAVVLSSIGADKPQGTGPIGGLRRLEQGLNAIAGLNVLHIRAGYFMENTLGQAGAIRAFGNTAGPVRSDLKLPMIATHDIGVAAADALRKLDFSGKQTRELLGQRELDYNEVTAVIAKAINKPGLSYVQLSDEQARPAFLQLGFSGSVLDGLLEMSSALNSGYIHALEKRSQQNTTPTSYEAFVDRHFVPLFREKSQAA